MTVEMLNILVCVKRVPATGAKITVTADERAIETRHLAFTVSPHEECAVEEAVRLVEKHGGRATVLTLGPESAVEQLRSALAIGVNDATLLAAENTEWDPQATARAIVAAVQEAENAGELYDLLLFGNESADSGGYQVAVRVAYALDRPCVSGVKAIEVAEDGASVLASREIAGGWERFRVSLPAVITVKEGINLPRYPPLRGKLQAKKKLIKRLTPERQEGGLKMVRLKTLPEEASKVTLLGEGPAAVPAILALLKENGFI